MGVDHRDRPFDPSRWPTLALAVLVSMAFSSLAHAHGFEGGDAAFVRNAGGPQIAAFLYLGAKHMVTGLDHLLFLAGVIFLLRRVQQVALQVSLFSLGHSITLLAGVLGAVRIDAHLVDAVIGLSVAYKAFDNLGGFKTLLGVQPDPRVAVLAFGLVHGLGLATRLQDLRPARAGLLTNMIAFNGGVEIGQFLALSILLIVLLAWRSRPGFGAQAVIVNTMLMGAGLCLAARQVIGWILAGAGP
jgi:hypothetical protein